MLPPSLMLFLKWWYINNHGQYWNRLFVLYKPVFIKNSGGMMLSDHLPFDTKHLCREVVRLVKSEQFTTSKISMTTLKISLEISMRTLKKLWQYQWQHWKEPWQYPRTPGDRIGSLRWFSPRGLSSITPKTFSWCHEACQVYCDLKSNVLDKAM